MTCTTFSVQQLVQNIEQCGGIANVQYENRRGYSRIFILTKDEVSLGRVTLKNGLVYSMKLYKQGYHTELDEGDIITLRLDVLLNSGQLVTESTFWELWEMAKEYCKLDLKEKITWRQGNPRVSQNGKTRSRKKLTGKNPRKKFIELLNGLK